MKKLLSVAIVFILFVSVALGIEKETILQGTINKYSHATPSVAGWDIEWTENGYDNKRTYTDIRDNKFLYVAISPTGAYQNQMVNFRQVKDMPEADIMGFQVKLSHTQKFSSMEYSSSIWRDNGKRYECAFQYWYGSNKFVRYTENGWQVLDIDPNTAKYLIWTITSSQQYTFQAECDITNGIKPLYIQVNQYRVDLNVEPSQALPNNYSEFVSQHVQLNGDGIGSNGAVKIDTLNTFTYIK